MTLHQFQHGVVYVYTLLIDFWCLWTAKYAIKVKEYYWLIVCFVGCGMIVCVCITALISSVAE